MFRTALLLLAVVLSTPATADVDAWAAEGWKTDFSKVEVDPTEILSVIWRDQIPSIDAPLFQPVADENDLTDVDPVVSLVVNGDARAYPLRIMMWHEIVNDVVGGMPVAVTYGVGLSVASVAPSFFASTIVIRVISRSRVTGRRLLLSGTLMGAGIGAMHYTGMAAMRMDAVMFYDPLLFAVSIVVAVTLATAALYANVRAN